MARFGISSERPTATEEGPAQTAGQHRASREVAMRQVIHAVDACPDCGCRLRGGSMKRHREVIEITLAPAVVTGSPVGRTDLSGVRQALGADTRRRGRGGWTVSLRTDPTRDDRAAARGGADDGAADSGAFGGCLRCPCPLRRDHGCSTHGRDTWCHPGPGEPGRCAGKSGGPRRRARCRMGAGHRAAHDGESHPQKAVQVSRSLSARGTLSSVGCGWKWTGHSRHGRSVGSWA